MMETLSLFLKINIGSIKSRRGSRLIKKAKLSYTPTFTVDEEEENVQTNSYYI